MLRRVPRKVNFESGTVLAGIFIVELELAGVFPVLMITNISCLAGVPWS